MSKEVENKLVPKLRFPDFKESEGWEVLALGNVGCIVTGKTPSTQDESLWDGEILFITPTDINGMKYQSETARSVVEKQGIKILPKGSIVYTCIASIGKISITEKKSITNQQINSIIVDKNFSNEFIYYYLINITPYIKSKPAVSTLAIINKTEFSAIKISLPGEKKEQEKIASCLSSLDDLITAESEKLDALKDYKKGLMQQLFPVEGEKVPKLRFPEFKSSGEWTKETLGELGKFAGGGTPSRFVDEYWNGDIPWISSSDITEDSIIDIKINRFITENALQSSAAKIIPKNSVLIVSRVGVGKLAVSDRDICTSQDFTNFTSIKIDIFFIAYYLKAQSNRLFLLSQGMAIKGFTKDDISQLKLLIPKDKMEQHKISDCLSSIDIQIAKQAQKITTLKTHKKGLMQQLFPNIN